MAVARLSPARTPEAAAIKVVETMPHMMYFLCRNVWFHRNIVSSMPQLRILGFLKNCPESSLSRLAESLGITAATASVTVDRLVKSGLVTRESNPLERRSIKLTLTDSGEKQLQAVRGKAADEVTRLFATLSPETLEQIDSTMSLLKELLYCANIKSKPSNNQILTKDNNLQCVFPQ